MSRELEQRPKQRLEHLAASAWRIRRRALRMGQIQGQGYIGQALGWADVLAVAYKHALNLRPDDPEWDGRDRFLLSHGHYAIAFYAALMEAGILKDEEMETYGCDDSRLPMSGMAAYTPGMEVSGGSLGHGLPVAVGMALALRHRGNAAFVYNSMSDGELDEGSTWEAAMSAAHHKLANLICLVDVNNQQADAPSTQVLNFEPLADKWAAFGWHVQRVNGNDLAAVVQAFDAARNLADARPRVILFDTKMCCGIPFLEQREKNHFVRVEADEWQQALDILDANRPAAAEPVVQPQADKDQPRLTTSAMIASIAAEGQPVVSAPFGKAMLALAEARADVVGMTGDLAKYTDLHLFAQAHPERFYQMGMAEQLLLAAAGGMAKQGVLPFVTSYAVFATRRAYDFIHQVIAEENLNVKICCALPGLTTGYGPSHQATDDLAMMRAIPGLTIVDPCDALDIEQAVPQIAAHAGPVYMRLLRGNVPLGLDQYDYSFELGKAKLLRDGKDALIIASGLMTMRALEAASLLEQDGIHTAVLHCPTIKPLDEETILREVGKQSRLIVVAENHSRIGGLGEAVASLLAEHDVRPARLRLAGLPDAFLDAGALPTLHERYGISSQALAQRVRRWL